MAALVEDLGLIPAPTVRLTTVYITLVPEDLLPTTCTRNTSGTQKLTQAKQPYIYINLKNQGFVIFKALAKNILAILIKAQVFMFHAHRS